MGIFVLEGVMGIKELSLSLHTSIALMTVTFVQNSGA